MSEVDFMDIFGDNLRDLLEEKGVGQNDLAREAGLSKQTISCYIHKQRMPSLPAFINICIALECDCDDLVPMYDYIH